MVKAFFVITDWDNVEALTQAFQSQNEGGNNLTYLSKARGSGPSDVLAILGLGESEKVFLASIVVSTEIDERLKKLRHCLGRQPRGAGIAWTVPIAAIAVESLKNIKEDEVAGDTNGTKDTIEIRHYMIVAVLNRGNSEAFMEKARSVGARGGTVINARGLGKKAEKFLGLTLPEEKELVFILADREKCPVIMDTLSRGLPKSSGVLYSLPVDRVMSLNEL
jgi:hypothetical protein